MSQITAIYEESLHAFIIRTGGAPLDSICSRFGWSKDRATAELNVLRRAGLIAYEADPKPPATFGDLIRDITRAGAGVIHLEGGRFVSAA